MKLQLWMWTAGLLVVTGCSGNVVLETSGNGGSGAGGNSGEGAAGAGATMGGTTSDTFTLGTGTTEGVCSPEIDDATNDAPDQLGFGPEPPPGGNYQVIGVEPDRLQITGDDGAIWTYTWAGSSLLEDFQVGDPVFVMANPGYGSYQVVENPTKARYVATYEDHLYDSPTMNEDAPFGGPSIGFGAKCAYSGSSCYTAWDANATVEFVVTAISIGQTASVGSFEVHNAKVTAIVCDLFTSDIMVTVRGPSEGPE